MTNGTLSLKTSSIHHQVGKATNELYAGTESIRLVATALGDRVGELIATAGPEELRQVAVIVKTHARGVLVTAAGLAGKAERLETIADICDAADPEPDPDTEPAASSAA
jgi:hypothetical protein